MRFESLPGGLTDGTEIGTDGMFGGEHDDGYVQQLLVRSGDNIASFVSVANGVPAGFAVSFQFLRGGSTFTVTEGVEGASDNTLLAGTDYILQANAVVTPPATGSSVQVWFRDPLPPQHHVKIKVE
ncbi:MAG: hypothetical protein NT062_23400 [Proteobacteria bacterium]|nr:hypothetical protein [Pseudomonadota bacterium]